MKNLKNFIALFLGVLFLSVSFGQDLIEAKDLAKMMKEENVVVVSAQKSSKYNDVHITGSINLPPAKLTVDEPVPYILASPEQMADILGAAGISEKNTIILYDEGSSKYSGRLYWALKYLGAEDVKILNGEIKAWQAARKPVTGSATKRKATTFTPNVQPQYLAEYEEVMKATTDDSYVIIDARSIEEYNGTNETKQRKGHIPGAVHIEYKDVKTKDGKLKNAETLKAMYEEKGVTSDKTVIIYCKSSVRAAIEFMALSSVLDYPNVKVYDGAFNEWQANPENELVTN
ncbi:MAG TPA: hypothetical protein DDX92_11155 [Flavobacteriales bacterium]|jgi:thiosulfate/3-mercaptopyruvate sulfurtransferase|nr:hypothetical protein [Flavobacteriales bacterium]